MSSGTLREQFVEQGFIGPFKLWEPEVMTQWWKRQRRVLLDQRHGARAPYANPMGYDRHLDIDALSDLVTEPTIVRPFQSLIGPDVLCWRTEFFPKNPGDPGTGWHQVERYAIGEAQRGMLEPTTPEDGVPMELTAWIAFTASTRENGCLRLLPGSHRRWLYDEMGPMKWDAAAAENTFFGYDYDRLLLNPQERPEEENAVDMVMAPGEVVIFTARCIHGSRPNTSNRQRMGFSIRVVPSHVKVYDGMTSFEEFGHSFDLARHACVLLGGADHHRHNRLTDANAWGRPFRKPLPTGVDNADAQTRHP